MARQATGIAVGVALVIGAGGPLAVSTASAATTVTSTAHRLAGGIQPPVPTAGCGSRATSATAGRSRPAA